MIICYNIIKEGQKELSAPFFMGKYLIADIVWDIRYKYPALKNFLIEYEYTGDKNASDIIEVTDDEILAEGGEIDFPKPYLEHLAIYRKISVVLLKKYDGMIFHSSSVEYGGNAFMFAASSGTGKSTHSALLKEYLGDKLKYINDDKPIIRYFKEDNRFIVYGTPWCGKHYRGNNVSAPLKAVCVLKRGVVNEIKKIEFFECFPQILRQTLRPLDSEEADKYFELIGNMADTVECYELHCNTEIEAAKTSFNGMMKEDKL